MARLFRDADREKRVLTADGQQVGSVSDASADRATLAQVDDGRELTEDVERLLGWAAPDGAPIISREQGNRYDEEAIHLRRLR